MELIEKVTRAIFRAGFHPDEDEAIVSEKWLEWPGEQTRCFTLAKAAIRAVLDGVEPVAFLFEHKEVGVEFSFDPLEQIGMTAGWTETPLYSLDVLKEALDHD